MNLTCAGGLSGGASLTGSDAVRPEPGGEQQAQVGHPGAHRALGEVRGTIRRVHLGDAPQQALQRFAAVLRGRHLDLALSAGAHPASPERVLRRLSVRAVAFRGEAVHGARSVEADGAQPVRSQWRHMEHDSATETGEPRVDQAVAGLDRLGDLPLDEHVAVFEDTHARLRQVLSELDSRAGG